MMEFKDRLKQLRTESGYSGEELGRRIGVSKAAIGNYESGYRKPRQEQLEALADVFNVDMDYLLCRTNTKLHISFEESRMKYFLNKLNQDGKREAVKRIEELTYIPCYIAYNSVGADAKQDTIYVLNAAHERTDIEVTDEMRKHDEDMMDDKNF